MGADTPRTGGALADVGAPGIVQITRYAYDDLDRTVCTVYPDSDDPINGTDGIYDRVELTYDENTNVLTVTEQREVVFTNTYDPANRLTDTIITLAAGVPGETRREYIYDDINRLIEANNNYARTVRTYTPRNQLESETQSIRLNGTGFTNGWQDEVEVQSET